MTVWPVPIIGLPFGAGIGTGVGGGGGYSAEAVQFFSRITDPGTTRKNAYAAIINSLVSAGVWAKLDTLYILAADISGNAVVNLKASSFTATLVNAPTFTADQGFVASGVDSYVDTNFNATTATTPNFVQNSAHFSVWDRTASGSVSLPVMGSNAAAAAGESNMFVFNGGSSFYGRVNSPNAAAFGTVPASSGFFLANRSSSSALQGYRNGAAVGAGVSDASAAPNNRNFRICQATSTNSNQVDQLAVASIGGSLTSTEAGNFYTALNTNKWW